MSTPHTQPSAEDSDARAALDAARAAHGAALALVQNGTESARAASAAVRHQLEERPYVALGVVAGVGFVIAGGLTSPAVWALARFGARFALAAATRKLGEVVLESK